MRQAYPDIYYGPYYGPYYGYPYPYWGTGVGIGMVWAPRYYGGHGRYRRWR